MYVICHLKRHTTWGRNPELFFNHILSLLYSLCDCDCILIAGDLNAKLGNHSDVLEHDDIPNRIINEYTSISSRGKSVIDYFITCHDQIRYFSNFNIEMVSDLVDSYKVQHLLSSTCKAPDHSVLSVQIEIPVTEYVNHHDATTSASYSNVETCPSYRRYSYAKPREGYLTNDDFITKIDVLKESIPISVETSYKNFCNLLDEERSRYLVYRIIYTDANNHNIVSNTKNTKPYWDDEVLELWKNMKTKEKLFTKCKNSCEQRSKLRQDFFIARREFDKTLRQKERIYYKTQMENMENMCKNNPNQFWNEIQKLGPKKK